MNTAVFSARTLLGLIFVVYGTNYFAPFVTLPAPSAQGRELLDAFAASGYFMPVLRLTQLACGLLLVSGRFVPLALVILAPIVLQIFLFDLFLDLAGLPMALLLLAMQLFLMWAYRHAYADVLEPRALPQR